MSVPRVRKTVLLEFPTTLQEILYLRDRVLLYFVLSRENFWTSEKAQKSLITQILGRLHRLQRTGGRSRKLS